MRIQFGPFTLDLDTRQLMRDRAAIHISPKAFQLLATLVEERPKVLAKSVLQERLWPETFVAEANLSNLIAEIRGALDDDSRKPSWVRTAYGFGYAFIGDAITSAGATQSTANRPDCWLEWGPRRFPLLPGAHVIGRDADVEIRLDATTVSRRHARLTVTGHEAVLEDFGSKNGTRRGSEHVTAPVHLADGDTLHFGSLLLTFHQRTVVVSTDTQAEATS